MQDYIELRIDADPCNEIITDLLAAFLVDYGFESFVPDSNGLIAYINSNIFNPEDIEKSIKDFPIQTEFSIDYKLVKGENWNEEWEKNYFKPIVIDNRVVIHSSFHVDFPKAEIDIVIDPKMAFGTGHHSTTSSMIRQILNSDVKGKEIIDMGTGTGILAILCYKLGAALVTGIEIDPFAYENAIENSSLNNSEIHLICGDSTSLEEVGKADIFLANINRNIILNDMDQYVKKIKNNGLLILSGFYSQDVTLIVKKAETLNLKLQSEMSDNNWVALKFKLNK